MKKLATLTLSALILTAPLALASPALAMGEHCITGTETVTVLIREATPAIPAVPPVYLTVTEYEFTHAQHGNGQGQGPANKWVEDANWNAEGNENSVGWVATGNTRVRTTDTILVHGKPAIPAQEAVYEQREIPVTTCEPVIEPTDPPVSTEPTTPATPPATEAPAPVETPAPTPTAEVIMEDDPRWDCHTMGNKICGPIAPVNLPAPPADSTPATAATPVQPQDQGQLANTGSEGLALVAGIGGALAAAGAVLRRRFS